MDILVIGKPALNIYFPLQETPKEGDIFSIRNQTESVGNVGATTACLLAKWRMPVHITGTMGSDGYAEKIRNVLVNYKRIDVKNIEIDYTHPTSLNYFTLNSKTGVSSKIICNDPNVQLQKYKYDFLPNWAVIDGTDYAGALALLNNNQTVKTIFYARIGDKDAISMSKRCTYVICTQVFAEMLTRESCDGTANSCVNLYQKLADMTDKNNFIIILNNHKILYSDEGQIKMLPAMKINAVDYSSFDSNFVGAFTFATVLNNNINDSIKFANMTAALSMTKVGEETAIPELDDVLDNSSLRAKMIINPNATTPEQPKVEEKPNIEQNIIGDNFVSNTVEAKQPEITPVQTINNPEPEVTPTIQPTNQESGIAPQVSEQNITPSITPTINIQPTVQETPVETNIFDK